MVKRTSSKVRMDSLIGLGILILFAIVFGSLVINTFGSHQSLENRPDWQGARWIEAGETSGYGYFRKSFGLSTIPQKAYLVVSGTEEFSVHVNKEYAGLQVFTENRPSTIIDVTRSLRQGKNLLAIRVNSNTHGIAPQLISRLVLINAGGLQSNINTDKSWRVSRKEGFQKEGNVTWVSPDYNDFDWLSANEVSESNISSALPLVVPERIYSAFPKGSWIWSGSTQDAILSHQFVVDGNKIHDGWIGVSTAGEYSLVVNGITVTSLQGSERTMEILNIAPYIKLGKNIMWLQVENKLLQPQLLVSGSVTTDSGLIALDSSAQWKVMPSDNDSPTPLNDVIKQLKVEPFSHTSSSLTLAYKDIAHSGMISTMSVLYLLALAFVVLTFLMGGFLLFTRFARMDPERNVVECLNLFVRPFILGLCVIGVFLLLQYDSRFVNYLTYQFYVLLIVPLVIVFLEIVILLEIRSQGRLVDGD